MFTTMFNNLYMQRITYLFCVIALLFCVQLTPASAQTGMNVNDLSKVKVDDLSDAQILSFLKQARSSGMSESELERVALQRGMSSTEVNKLRLRIETLQTNRMDADGSASTTTGSLRSVTDTIANDFSFYDSGMSAQDSLRRRIFGSSLFMSKQPLFEPNLQLATPKNYVVGPGDQLNIDIFGQSEVSHHFVISPEGTINIPFVGVINVGGLTIEEATSRIRNKLTSVYGAIRTGGTNVNVVLGNIRTIKVIITGEVVKPGTYSLPSLASVFNALYSAGGPSVKGSFREIRLIRNNQVIANIDLYEFLQKGYFDQNIRLEDSDVILVPPYLSRVELTGEVKSDALFELKPGETFADLLAYSGGFSERAYQQRVKVIRNTGIEQRIEDVLQTQFAQFEPQTGDIFTVDKILDRFENRVTIEGSVFRPGEFELSPGLTLSMLIKKADGLKEDAFLNRGMLIRHKDDLQMEQLSFNVAEILAGTAPDIILKREDLIRITSVYDLKEVFTVDIEGEIRRPGTFNFAEGMTLQDLIVMAGGFRESASEARIEIARRIRNSDVSSESAAIAEVFQLDINRLLSKHEQDFQLSPFDKVIIRTASGYETQKIVRIEGEVLYPGSYPILRKDERITDLVQRAGGFTAHAYMEGASLKRSGRKGAVAQESAAEIADRELKEQEEATKLATFKSLQRSATTENVGLEEANLRNDYVGINMERIIDRPGTKGDLILEDGDIVRIPKELQTVKISGEVLAPSTAIFNSSKSFKQYISQAGGFSTKALKRSSYVLYANGSVKSTNRFLFFNNYPPIKPGAEIFVPQKPERERMSAQQWIGVSTGIASLAAIILTIVR
jgi:protein involved in polysaccharide export with SLBB domain